MLGLMLETFQARYRTAHEEDMKNLFAALLLVIVPSLASAQEAETVHEYCNAIDPYEEPNLYLQCETIRIQTIILATIAGQDRREKFDSNDLERLNAPSCPSDSCGDGWAGHVCQFLGYGYYMNYEHDEEGEIKALQCSSNPLWAIAEVHDAEQARALFSADLRYKNR